MTAYKKRKVEDECRVFNEECTVKYYLRKLGIKQFLCCCESVAIFKEYHLERHNQTKHANFGQNFTSEERKRKCQELVNKMKKQQSVFTKQSIIQNAATEASFIVSYKLAKRNKPFSDGEFIKECMSDVASIMCPEHKTKLNSIALSRRTVVRRVQKISDDLMSQWKDTSKQFLWYSLALDESNDAQLLVYIRGVDANFQLTEELLSVESLKDTTTGKDLYHAVENCIARIGLEWNNMASVTTDGARALTGKNVGLLKLMNDKIKAEHPGHALTPLHCAFHQERLCKGALNIKHVTDSIVNVQSYQSQRA